MVTQSAVRPVLGAILAMLVMAGLPAKAQTPSPGAMAAAKELIATDLFRNLTPLRVVS